MADKVAQLFGTRVAQTILASGQSRSHEQVGHMSASDPIKSSLKTLANRGRPHMGPGLRRGSEKEFDATSLAAQI